jgi:hypothetical protein
MFFWQGGHESAGVNFAFCQAGTIGLVRKADESRVKPAFENCAGLRERREIEEMNGRFGNTTTKTFQHGGHEGMKQSPNISEVQLRTGRFAGIAGDANGLFALLQKGLGLHKKGAAGFGESYSVVSAFEQLDAKLVFELANLAAQGGLRHVQLLRRAGEIQFTGHGGKIAQMTEFH